MSLSEIIHAIEHAKSIVDKLGWRYGECQVHIYGEHGKPHRMELVGPAGSVRISLILPID